MAKDQKLNLRFDNRGSAKCHGNLDLVMTPTGDRATISSVHDLFLQDLLVWLATPLGEDIDPKCGCILYKYMFSPAVWSKLQQLELELKSNLQYNFPDHHIGSVRCQKAYDEATNTHCIAVSAMFNRRPVSFIVNQDDLITLRSQVKRTLGTLENITRCYEDPQRPKK